MVAVLALSLIGLVLWGVSKWYERGIERGRQTRYDEKWSGSGSADGEDGRRSGKVTPTL